MSDVRWRDASMLLLLNLLLLAGLILIGVALVWILAHGTVTPNCGSINPPPSCDVR